MLTREAIGGAAAQVSLTQALADTEELHGGGITASLPAMADLLQELADETNQVAGSPRHPAGEQVRCGLSHRAVQREVSRSSSIQRRRKSCEGFRVGDGSRGRFVTPADSPLQDWSPCRRLHVRRELLGVQGPFFCRPRAKP
jgi:hypothetical protein